MNGSELVGFYERVYFHAHHQKEQISTRIQLLFGIDAFFISGFSYMWRMLDYEASQIAVYLFIALMVVSAIFFALSIQHMVRSYWGNVYKIIPAPTEMDEHRSNVIQYIDSVKDYNQKNPSNAQEEMVLDDEMSDFVKTSLTKCASWNQKVNADRSAELYRAFLYTLLGGAALLLSSAVFVINDLDVSSPRKETLIRDTSNTHAIKDLAAQMPDEQVLLAKIENLEDLVRVSNQRISDASSQLAVSLDKLPSAKQAHSLIEVLKGVEEAQIVLAERIKMSESETEQETPPERPSRPEPQWFLEDVISNSELEPDDTKG